MDKLVFVAETLGIAPSQVAAVAVSEYVAAKAIAFGAAEKDRPTNDRSYDAAHGRDVQKLCGQGNRLMLILQGILRAATVLGGGTNKKTGEVIPERPVLQIETLDSRGLVEVQTITVPNVDGWASR